MIEPPQSYKLHHETPTLDDYQRLRKLSGLTPFPPEAAEAGLPGTLLAVTVEHNGETIGMGRVVGDGGLFFQIVDIAVLPVHQGKGLGKTIMHDLTTRLAAQISTRAYVSLIADGEANRLYAQYGFAPTMPKSIGMAQVIG